MRVIWGSCQAARAFPRMPPGPLAGVPKARKPKGAKSPAGRSKARRADRAHLRPAETLAAMRPKAD